MMKKVTASFIFRLLVVVALATSGESRTVDVHIGQLRKKLELYDEIKTIPKLGYRLEE